MVVDNASASVIRNTDPETHSYVRLYFRPRTPTFFRNEGIRPLNQREAESHCPVPVAFLLDAKHILGMSSSRFTDGGHNSWRHPPRVGTDVQFLRTLPWEVIVQGNLLDRRLSQTERDDIVRRQNAEVQIPDQLSLDGLRYVFARSPAELETLRALLRRMM